MKAEGEEIATKKRAWWRPALRVRTLMAAVALVAVVLAVRLYLIRKEATHRLIEAVTQRRATTVIASGQPGQLDYQLFSQTVELKTALWRAQKVGASAMAASQLSALADRAYRAGDSVLAHNALSILTLLGRDARGAHVVATRIARTPGPLDVRLASVQLLGRLALTEADARDELIALVAFESDPAFEKWLWDSVLQQLQMLQGRAKGAVPALLGSLNAHRGDSFEVAGRRLSILRTLAMMRSDAAEAIPDIQERLLDRREAPMVRHAALDTLCRVALFIGPNTETPDVLPADVLAAIRKVADEHGPENWPTRYPRLAEEARNVFHELDRRAQWKRPAIASK